MSNNAKIKGGDKRDKSYIVLSTSLSPHYKTLVYVNECKIITHPDKKRQIWMTRCIQILDAQKVDIGEIVHMIATQKQYIYIAGIKRFAIVTKKHLQIIELSRTLFGIQQYYSRTKNELR